MKRIELKFHFGGSPYRQVNWRSQRCDVMYAETFPSRGDLRISIRISTEPDKGAAMNEDKQIKLDVAILGGGFAGVYCAKALTEALRKKPDFKVGLISQENYMVFQPMLAEVAGSSISPRHVVNPLRLLCKRASVYQGVVESVNWPKRSLLLNAGPFSGNVLFTYEHLVLALGEVTDLRHVPGMPEHAFMMKNVG